MPRHITAATIAAAALLALTACGSSGDTSADSSTTPSASTSAVSPALIAGLSAIDPGLVVNEDRALRRAERVCEKVKAKEPTSSLVEYVQDEFEGGNVPSLTDTQAQAIITAVKTTICT